MDTTHQPKPLQESDLIFSSASSALKEALGELKRSNLSIKNRLKSIKQDADFVTSVADAYQLPLVANERCGSWYIAPERKAGSAYFKSTDGHFGQWSFSLRRLNLQVLDVIQQYGGCIIVDSTRRGKSMPDALSKTVPIWATVLNRLLFPDDEEFHELSTPMDVISESEHAQIEARLFNCLQDFRKLGLETTALRVKLHNAPLQVTWQRPGDVISDILRGHKCQNLIVLCTASNQTSNETSATSDYVQGAADDPESWSMGLDASLFWKHNDMLLSASEDDLPSIISRIVLDSRSNSIIRPPSLIKPTSNLWIGTNGTAESMPADYDLIVSCSSEPNQAVTESSKHQYVHLRCAPGKVGSRQLRSELPKLDAAKQNLVPTSKVLVTCDTGKDLAVGAALALLCLCFDDNGKPLASDSMQVKAINKTLIKQRLSSIMVSMPDASPSRTTLQSVNAFLMN